MKERLVAVLSGALFAVGLALSGMTDPSKVLGFLDVAGAWDPSLGFVMGGAVGTHLIWLQLVAPRLRLFASAPTAAPVDARLVGGAAIFGVGWGLSGYCPGPALVATALGNAEAAAFAVSMLSGIILFNVLGRRPSAPKVETAQLAR